MTGAGDVEGAVFLLSAALDIGDVKEFALRQDHIAKLLTTADEKKRVAFELKHDIQDLKDRQRGANQPEFGIADNPFRYSEMFYNGASQLSRLLDRIAAHYRWRTKYSDIGQPVFIFVAVMTASPRGGVTTETISHRNRAIPAGTGAA